MTAQRKWTTFGLSDREEALLKSLMGLLDGRTAVPWRQGSGFEADLAFCDPQAPFSRIALQRQQSHGRPVCISVIRHGQTPLPDTPVLTLPVRSSEFLALLERLSARPAAAAMPAAIMEAASRSEASAALPATPPAVAPVAASAGSSFALARLVRSLHERDPRGRFRLENGEVWVDLDFQQRQYRASPGTEQDVVRALLADGTTASEQPVRDTVPIGKSRPLERFLWLCGVLGPGDRLLPWLDAQGGYRLRQWPDFGGLPDSAPFIGLGAFLVNSRCAPADIVRRTGHPAQQVGHFLNACELLGLLITEQRPTAVVIPLPIPADPVAETRSGVFGKIRTALKMVWR